MRCKPILLGGLMVMALSGAAALTPGLAQDTPAQTPPDQSTQTPGTEAPGAPSQTKPAMHHHRHHAKHAMHAASTPAEDQATEDLNRQQLQMAQGSAQPMPSEAPAPAQPGGPTAQRLHGSVPTQSAIPGAGTGGGGGKDSVPPVHN